MNRLVSVARSLNGQVGVISINRPAAKNAISKDLLKDLFTSIDEVTTDKKIRSVIFRSTVPGVFCAGADLKERKTMTEEETRAFVQSLRDVMTAISSIEVPTIAAIDGAALGGGLELALSCDFRTAAPEALVGLPETSLAIIPGAGGTQRLPRVVGLQNAKMLTLTARKLRAKDAVSMGLVDVVPGVNCKSLPVTEDAVHADLKELLASDFDKTAQGYITALRLAQEICPNGPVGVKAAKQALVEGMQIPNLKDAMAAERRAYDRVIPTEDRMEALRAFAEKRKPEFKGM